MLQTYPIRGESVGAGMNAAACTNPSARLGSRRVLAACSAIEHPAMSQHQRNALVRECRRAFGCMYGNARKSGAATWCWIGVARVSSKVHRTPRQGMVPYLRNGPAEECRMPAATSTAAGAGKHLKVGSQQVLARVSGPASGCIHRAMKWLMSSGPDDTYGEMRLNACGRDGRGVWSTLVTAAAGLSGTCRWCPLTIRSYASVGCMRIDQQTGVRQHAYYSADPFKRRRAWPSISAISLWTLPQPFVRC